MPDYLSFMNKSITDVENKLVSYLKENTDIKVIYSKDELIKYKDEYQLYYKADPHWNYLSGYIAYQHLMKEIGMNYVDVSRLLIKKINSSSTPKVFANFISLSEINEFKYDIDYEIVTTDNKKNLNIPYYEPIFKIESYRSKDVNALNLLCFRDSFIGVMGYFGYHFKHSTFVNLDLFKPKDMEKVFDNDIDIVIFETVENKLEGRLLNVLPKYTEEIKKINDAFFKANVITIK